MEVLKAGLTDHLFVKQFGQTPTAMGFINRPWEDEYWVLSIEHNIHTCTYIDCFDRELISENSSNNFQWFGCFECETNPVLCVYCSTVHKYDPSKLIDKFIFVLGTVYFIILYYEIYRMSGILITILHNSNINCIVWT